MASTTKAKLAEVLVENSLDLAFNEAKDFVDAALDEMNAALAEGEDVKIPGLGTFALRHKSPRPGRNPRTKVEVLIAARTVVSFRASTKLREKIDHSVRVQSD